MYPECLTVNQCLQKPIKPLKQMFFFLHLVWMNLTVPLSCCLSLDKVSHWCPTVCGLSTWVEPSEPQLGVALQCVRIKKKRMSERERTDWQEISLCHWEVWWRQWGISGRTYEAGRAEPGCEQPVVEQSGPTFSFVLQILYVRFTVVQSIAK